MPGGILPVLRGVAPGPQLYSHALSAAYNFEWPIFEPSFSEQRENDVWELIRRDAKIMQAITLRSNAVASKDTSIDPGGEEEADLDLANFVDDALKNILSFRESRSNLAAAIFRGRSYAFVEGCRQNKKIGKWPARNWWLPKRIRDIDKRRFQVTPKKDGERVYTITELWHVGASEFREIKRPELFIEVVYGDEEARLRYGRPLLDSLYFLWWAKSNAMKEGLQAMERWAQGLIVAKIDTEKAGAVGTDVDTVKDETISQIEKHRSRNVLVMDRRDDIQVVSGATSGHQIVREFLQYIDEQIIGLAMGSVLPFGAQSQVGSFARAKVEQDVSSEMLEFDRAKIDEAISQSLIRLIVELNAPILAEFGINVQERKMPRFMTSTKVVEDPSTNADVIAKMLTVPGMKLDQDWVYSKIGAPRPKDNADVFETPPGIFPGGSLGGGSFDPKQEGDEEEDDNGEESKNMPQGKKGTK